MSSDPSPFQVCEWCTQWVFECECTSDKSASNFRLCKSVNDEKKALREFYGDTCVESGYCVNCGIKHRRKSMSTKLGRPRKTANTENTVPSHQNLD